MSFLFKTLFVPLMIFTQGLLSTGQLGEFLLMFGFAVE
jgi:hypothetical protein